MWRWLQGTRRGRARVSAQESLDSTMCSSLSPGRLATRWSPGWYRMGGLRKKRRHISELPLFTFSLD